MKPERIDRRKRKVHLTSRYRKSRTLVNGYIYHTYCGNNNIQNGDSLYDATWLATLKELHEDICKECINHPDLYLELLKRLTETEEEN